MGVNSLIFCALLQAFLISSVFAYCDESMYYCSDIGIGEDLAVGIVVSIIIGVILFVACWIVVICYCCACCCFMGRRQANRKGQIFSTQVPSNIQVQVHSNQQQQQQSYPPNPNAGGFVNNSYQPYPSQNPTYYPPQAQQSQPYPSTPQDPSSPQNQSYPSQSSYLPAQYQPAKY